MIVSVISGTFRSIRPNIEKTLTFLGPLLGESRTVGYFTLIANQMGGSLPPQSTTTHSPPPPLLNTHTHPHPTFTLQPLGELISQRLELIEMHLRFSGCPCCRYKASCGLMKPEGCRRHRASLCKKRGLQVLRLDALLINKCLKRQSWTSSISRSLASTFSLPSSKSTFSQSFKEKCISRQW